VEKDSKEWVDRLPADAKSRLDSAVEGAKQALRTGDPDVIRKALDELNTAYSAAGASLYQAGQAQEQQPAEAGSASGGPESGGEGAKGQDDVVEADYEIVDDKK
jgi:molecular chaperone DnaK